MAQRGGAGGREREGDTGEREEEGERGQEGGEGERGQEGGEGKERQDQEPDRTDGLSNLPTNSTSGASPSPPADQMETNSQPSGPAPSEEPTVDVTSQEGSGQSVQNMLSSIVYSLGLCEAEEQQYLSHWHNRTIVPMLEPSILT